MDNRFYTNREKALAEIINSILPKSNAADILVGYFYFSGYRELSEKLKDKQVRILVGIETDNLISGSIDNENKSFDQIKNEYYKGFVKMTNETNALDSEDAQSQFEIYMQKLKDGTLQIKKTLKECHAKMYVFSYNDTCNENGEEPGTVITGSSNLTYSGLNGDRIEINARFTEKSAYNEAEQLFNELWEDAITIADKDSLDVWTDVVINKIWCGRTFPPYQMFLRVLKEYFSIKERKNLLTPYDINSEQFSNLRYQTDAVKMALDILDNHNGVIISDVVGLGKSVIASTVARNLYLKTIVVCPPHLVSSWDQDYISKFELKLGKVFSAGSIDKALDYYNNVKKKNDQFLIIVDEAHRFRNDETKDYSLLHELCTGNKVLLLTATPFNNNPSDIYSLLKLFQIPTQTTLKTVDNLAQTFKELIDKYGKLRKDQKESKADEKKMKREVDAISGKIRSIIQPLVIRRSRIDLIQIPEYAEDLKKQGYEPVIPNDPEEMTYNLGKLEKIYTETLQDINSDPAIGKFKAARYSPALYLKEDKKEEINRKLEEYGVKVNLLIGRQNNVSDFMRHLLVSRFESSIEAFKKSLENMISVSAKILEWIDKRHAVPVYKKGNITDLVDLSNENMDEIDSVLETYTEKGFFEIPIEYISDQFKQDVEKDILFLTKLQSKWNKVKEDPKLESVAKILKEMLENDPKRKIVLFTQYSDTADYVGKELKLKDLRVMKYTSSDASQSNRDKIRLNFDANVKNEDQKNDFDILVATDAISEGFNLHRAGTIFNYDIPYNPTRVIQRIGRINRINKKMFDQLFIYNYFPTETGEGEVGIKRISTLKMSMIHAIMGEDTKALTKDEDVKAFFKDQFRKEMANNESESWDTKYRRILDSAKGTKYYKDALSIPLRARIARNSDNKKGVLMFGKYGSEFVFKLCDGNQNDILLSAEEGIDLFCAEKDEESVSLSKNFYKIYQVALSNLFSGNDQVTKKSKDVTETCDKIKVLKNTKLLPEDYVLNLKLCAESEALTSYEMRKIRSARSDDDMKNLQETITTEYLKRLIEAKRNETEKEEKVIMSEELL